LLLPAGRPSHWDIGGAIDNLHLSLDPHFVQQLAHDACGMPPEQVELRDVFTGRDPQIAALGNQLLRELTTAGGRLYAESLTTLLAIHLLRTYSTRQPSLCPAKGGLPPHALRRVLAYIDAHLDQPLGLADLAALVSLSTPYFLRMFKHAMGLAPHQYVIQCRIARAKEHLTTSALPIAEVAVRVGFRTQSHFTMHFRRLTGLTPTAYRSAHGRQTSPRRVPEPPHCAPDRHYGRATHPIPQGSKVDMPVHTKSQFHDNCHNF
jgi:AraC family transcriptional regulator